MEIPTLKTARLVLRPFRASDFEPYARAHAQPEIVRYLSADGKPFDAGLSWRSLAALVGHWQLRGFGSWALEERASGEWVGRMGLHRPEPWPETELAYMLDSPFQKKGYGVEAGQVAQAWARSTLGLTRLVSYVHSENGPSQALARRLGAKREGTHVISGVTCDVWAYAL